MESFSDCKSCGEKAAVTSWIQVHASFEMARLHGRPGFLDMLSLPCGLMKIAVCYACQTMKPVLEFTPEEIAGMKEYKEECEKSGKVVAEFGKLFGMFRGGPKKP